MKEFQYDLVAYFWGHPAAYCKKRRERHQRQRWVSWFSWRFSYGLMLKAENRWSSSKSIFFANVITSYRTHITSSWRWTCFSALKHTTQHRARLVQGWVITGLPSKKISNFTWSESAYVVTDVWCIKCIKVVQKQHSIEHPYSRHERSVCSKLVLMIDSKGC